MAGRTAASVLKGLHRMTVGLRPLELGEWIEDAPDHDDQLREKHRLLNGRNDVLASLPGSEDACDELLSLLCEHLPRHLPHRYDVVQGRLRAAGLDDLQPQAQPDDGPLASAARLVPEDLCLMAPGDQGRFHLAAAALCFPTRWRLHDKLGETMDVIHAPVPGYQESVGAATDRVMSALTPERPLWRQNWTLLDSPALYQPVRVALETPLDAKGFGSRLWLRSERQTLRRLPRSGYVLFTIRIRQCRLESACEIPGLAARLATQIRSMPPALKAYKALTELEPALLAYLDGAHT
jgi:hypothetical protein